MSLGSDENPFGEFVPVLKTVSTKERVMIARFFKDESGATAIEYGLIAAATGLALVAVMPSIKSSLTATFTSIDGALQ